MLKWKKPGGFGEVCLSVVGFSSLHQQELHLRMGVRLARTLTRPWSGRFVLCSLGDFPCIKIVPVAAQNHFHAWPKDIPTETGANGAGGSTGDGQAAADSRGGQGKWQCCARAYGSAWAGQGAHNSSRGALERSSIGDRREAVLMMGRR